MIIPFGSYKIRTHEQGNVFIYGMAITSLISILASGISTFSVCAIVLCASCIGFFRDPERITVSRNNNDIFSAADGVVTAIAKEVSCPKELETVKGKKFTKISTFLSVFNVHVNRSPVEGEVKEIAYHKGLFINASSDKSSDKNERNSVVIQAKDSKEKIAVVQIAGLIARRIICDANAKQVLEAGERFGIIKFGSRVDLYIPKNYNVNVNIGQTVIAGETIMAFEKQ